jgi:hypothetical protein
MSWLNEHPDAYVSVSGIAQGKGDGAELAADLKQTHGASKTMLKVAVRDALKAGTLREDATDHRGGRIFRLAPVQKGAEQ